jgi:calcineurin-like phosphoesterase family protein
VKLPESPPIVGATERLQPGPRDWFISDHHFGHANIIKHASRPFADVRAMDEAMVVQWNSVVGHNDRVFHLGDLYWGADPAPWKAIRRRLNGQILLVPGNHDPVQALHDAGVVDAVLPPLCEVPYRCQRTGHKRYLVLCHFPLAEWPRLWSGAIHLHGHTHGNLPGGHPAPPGLRRLDVSADTVGFTPLSPQDIIDRFPSKATAQDGAVQDTSISS